MASQILGLFTSPEQYRAMQNQQGENAAIQYAQLTPFQRADVSLYTGGRQLGQSVGSLFGVQDPQLQKITMRQQMLTGAGGGPRIDMNDPNSIRRAAVVAQEQGDSEFFMALNDYARKVESEMALIQQRTKEGRAAAIPKELQIASARAELQDTIARLEADQVANPNDANIARALSVAKSTLAGLPLKTEGLVREQQIARDLALSAGPEGSEAYSTAYNKNLRDLTTKTTQEKLGEFERVLNARYPDTPENTDKRAQLMDQFLTNEISGRKTGKGTKVDIGGINLDTGKAGEAAGKKVGEELIDVKNKQSALDSIADAKAILKQGIYAGAYGPAGKIVAKYTGIGSKDKVARTEEFVSYIGNVVIPRLKEFGGNDSEQELKYLNNVMGGNLEMEPAALSRILDRAEKNIQRGIERLRKQAETGETKKPLTSLIPRSNENIERPSEPAMTMPGTPTAPVKAPIAKPPATKAPVKGQKQTRTLKSGKVVTVEVE